LFLFADFLVFRFLLHLVKGWQPDIILDSRYLCCLNIQGGINYLLLVDDSLSHVDIKRLFHNKVLYQDAVKLPHTVRPILCLTKIARNPIQLSEYHVGGCGECDADTSSLNGTDEVANL